jgi:hypothetical protein
MPYIPSQHIFTSYDHYKPSMAVGEQTSFTIMGIDNVTCNFVAL